MFLGFPIKNELFVAVFGFVEMLKFLREIAINLVETAVPRTKKH